MFSIPVILTGLVIESVVLCRLYDFELSRGFTLAVVVNAVSALAGLILIPLGGLIWELFAGFLRFYSIGPDTFGIAAWAAAFVIALVVTTTIEVLCLTMLWKIRWSRMSVQVWLLANTASIGLVFARFAFVPLDQHEIFKAWLFR